MNKKALLIGGAVLVAGFLAYRFMNKGKAETQKSLEDTDTTGNEDLADETTGAASLEKVEVQGKPAEEAVAVSEQKPIKSANDLKGTALGQAISIELASPEDLQAIDKCVTSMSEAEQKVLSAIAYNSPKEVASPEFQGALVTKYGAKAKELSKSVLSKLYDCAKISVEKTKTNKKKVITPAEKARAKRRLLVFGLMGGAVGVGALALFDKKTKNVLKAGIKNRRNCKDEAINKGLRGKAKRDYKRKCVKEGGVDTESSDFAFNGLTF
jgi:hypothetical protein